MSKVWSRGVLLLVAVFALTACSRGAAQTPSERADPALRAALAVLALQRSGDQKLTADQVGEILPLLKVLRDTAPDDHEASQAIAEKVFAVFTPAQRAVLERLRAEGPAQFQQRNPDNPAGPSRPGVGAGPRGSTPDPARRAEFRRRALDRAIQILEPQAR